MVVHFAYEKKTTKTMLYCRGLSMIPGKTMYNLQKKTTKTTRIDFSGFWLCRVCRFSIPDSRLRMLHV